VKIVSTTTEQSNNSIHDSNVSSSKLSNLKEHAVKRIHAKDDNNKAEQIDGGGGVWYDYDVSEDEQEGKNVDDHTTNAFTSAAAVDQQADTEMDDEDVESNDSEK
jgi:hypothetical protein